MSDKEIPEDKKVKYKYLCGPNQMLPKLMGGSSNLILFPYCASPARLYMAGNMIPKSVVTFGATERMITTGFEDQYAETARRIEAPSNMVVEEVFYVQAQNISREPTDAWNSMWVIFKNDEKNAYDVLELPRYNVQNHYVGFEYKYNKDVMRKLVAGATIPKGTRFAQSPRISESGEWMFGMNVPVAAVSHYGTEEDAIWIADDFAANDLRCVFKHDRAFQWNESEYVPVMLYGTPEDPRPFAQSGERIREDGLVMAFRRRVSENALVSLTRKALRTPDLTYDILFYAPPNCEVMSVEVLGERMKDRSNNRGTDYIDQPHTNFLDRFERKQNEFSNNVMRWYERRVMDNNGEDINLTLELGNFINSAYGNHTINVRTGKRFALSRGVKQQKLKDWNVKILLREIFPGKIKSKFAGTHGDKAVAVHIIPAADMPTYADGRRAKVISNNVPAFRRQIYSLLMELGINFINVSVQMQANIKRKAGDYAGAFEDIAQFCETGFPEFGEIVRATIVGESLVKEYVDDCCTKMITVHSRSDAKLFGVNIINAYREKYNFSLQKAQFRNSLGEMVWTENPILIANQHFMMLDKFGVDMSAQALPKANLYGMPAKLNDSTKYGHWIKDQGNRNTGETEGRARTSQHGGQETAKQLAMAYSPGLRVTMVQRIIRAHDSFDIDQLVRPDEYIENRAVKMAAGMLSDSGYVLRRERPDDKTPSTNSGLYKSMFPDATDDSFLEETSSTPQEA